VQLKSGGYIVINPTEALVSIDVNSGRSTREHHIEDTALKTNMEAAEEIARQLRLRDLAGLIVIDFIDMEEKRNNRNVERKLKDALRHDRARIQVGRISHFGLMEMSRQRIRTGVLESSTEVCPVCGGTGHVRAVSSVALQLLRGIEDQLMKSASHDVVVRAKPDVALYVLNNKRAHLRQLEDQFGVMIVVQADTSLTGQQSFAVERGGIARQKPVSAAPRISLDSVAVEIGAEEEEAGEQDALSAEEGEAQERHEHEREHDHGDGQQRRRRRRRGRRGRGGGDRQQTPEQHAAGGEAEFSDTGDTGFAPQGETEAAGTPGEGQGEHGSEPRRRRRRGRRGGRRNRDRQSRDAFHPQGMEAHQSGSDFEAEGMPDTEQNFAPSYESRQESTREEQAPAPSVSSSTPGDEPAPKRRSTVREAAPIVNFEQDGGSSSYSPSSPAREEPSESKGGGDIEPERPRRSGWWSRFRGGD
jgi:ribonuclease E